MFLFCATDLVAQKETYTWPFGYKRMLTFHGGQMQYVDSINELVKGGRNTSISDCAGNLLLYSDGVLVKNGSHDTIVNGYLVKTLYSNSNILLKNIHTDSIYHLFITPLHSNPDPYPEVDSTIQEIVVNMNFNNGNGKVIKIRKGIRDSLNIPQITLISDANDSTFWLIANYFGGKFEVYPVGDTGMVLNPVSSNLTLNFDWGSPKSDIRFSPSGTKLLRYCSNFSIPFPNIGNLSNLVYGINLFNFNRTSGQVTFDRYIQLPDLGVENAPSLSTRGLTAFEFSPNERYLYCFYNRYSVLWQIDLTLPSNHPFAYQYISIPQSDKSKLIWNKPLKVQDEQREDMLISPHLNSLFSPFVENSHLFQSQTDTVYLSEIATPNNPLSFAGFTYKKLNLGQNFGPSGQTNYLPHFPQGLTKTVIYSNTCTGDTIQFEVSSLVGVDSLYWHFGDSASGNNNTYKGLNPIHVFQNPGEYQITTTVFRSGGCTDSILTQFYAQEQPNFMLPSDTFFCAGDTLNIGALNPPVASYRWLDTLVFGYQRNIYDSGTYILESFNDCGMDKDTFIVYKIPQPNPNLGTDTTICFGDTLYFDKTQNYTQTIWQDGDSLPQKMVTATDSLVWLESSNICGVLRDSLLVDFHLAKKPDLGTDTAICLQDTLQFSVNFEYDSLIWNTQNKADTFFSSQGKVVAELYNVCGYFTDTINIDTLFPLPPKPQLPAVVSICNGDSVTLSVNDTLSQYLWNTGAITSAIVVDTGGNFKVRVSNICGLDSAESIVEFHNPLSINLNPDTGICQGVIYQITIPLAAIEYDSVIWNGWIKSPTVLGLSGNYDVAVYNACGVYYDTTTVNRINTPQAQLPNDTAICQKDSLLIRNKTYSKYNIYHWSTGSQSDSLRIKQQGTYFITVTNNCGTSVDSMNLGKIINPKLKLIEDTIICNGESLKLFNLLDSTQNLVWNTGDTSTVLITQTEGIYIATLYHECGFIMDTLLLKKDTLLTSPFQDTLKWFCNGDTIIFEADSNARKVVWNNGLTQSQIAVNTPQVVTVKQSNKCGTMTDSIRLANYPLPKEILNDYIICLEENIEVTINQPFINIFWEDSSTSNTKTFNQNTQIKVLMYNQCADTIFQEINILQEIVSDSLSFENGWLSTTYKKGKDYQWFLNGIPIETESEIKFLPLESGNYQLLFLDEYNCQQSQWAQIKRNQLANCENWRLYPNPLKDALNLFLPGEALKKLEIFDITGKLILRENYENGIEGNYFSMPLQLSQGVYFFRISMEGCTKIKRIVVE